MICRAEKISGLYEVSVEPVLLINTKPRMTTAIPIANKMKFIFPKAKFFLSSIFYVSGFRFQISRKIFHFPLITSPSLREGRGGLYILYSSPAVIRRNLFTETYEQSSVMSKPKMNTEAAVISITCHVMTVSTSCS